MKKYILILLLICSSLCHAAPTKSTAAVDEWAETAQNAVREGATTDISGCYAATLHIEFALTSETAHTGTKIEVQLSSNTSGDEDWTTYKSWISPTGTPNSEAFSNSESATDTVLEVADTTGLYDDDEARWIFAEDNTVANSEMMYLVSHSANASVTVQDGITNAHDASDTMYDIAAKWTVELPMTANRVRVMIDNTYDSNGATCHNKVRITKVTGL